MRCNQSLTCACACNACSLKDKRNIERLRQIFVFFFFTFFSLFLHFRLLHSFESISFTRHVEVEHDYTSICETGWKRLSTSLALINYLFYFISHYTIYIYISSSPHIVSSHTKVAQEAKKLRLALTTITTSAADLTFTSDMHSQCSSLLPLIFCIESNSSGTWVHWCNMRHSTHIAFAFFHFLFRIDSRFLFDSIFFFFLFSKKLKCHVSHQDCRLSVCLLAMA